MNVVPSLVDATSPLYLRRTRLVQFVEVLSAWYLRNRQQERGGPLNAQPENLREGSEPETRYSASSRPMGMAEAAQDWCAAFFNI